MGFDVGSGVGWDPRFVPEVVVYVEKGCMYKFNVYSCCLKI